MVGDQLGIVEEHQQPVPGEVLERAAVLDHQLAHRALVLAKDPEQLLRLGRLGERREAAEVAEHGRDEPPVTLVSSLQFLRPHSSIP